LKASDSVSPLPEVQVKSISSPTPVKPVLVCGLPGSGYVGKLAADYLVTVFKAKKVAEIYATSFPPHVNINEQGIGLRLKGDLFHAETGQQNDLLVFTADAQPSTSDGEYSLADAVLKLARSMKTKQVFSLAAYITGNFVKDRKVYGTATASAVLSKLSGNGVQVMKEGGISGMNGVMIGMAKLHGMEGVSLLGETSGYLLDPSASYSVLDALSRILGLKIDLTSIEERAKEAQQIFGQVQRMTQQEEEEPRPPKDDRKPGYIG
jgi:uncharacterized protein (TIGR00162 family)